MLRYEVIKGRVQIITENTPPRVYLDYCVLRRFSDLHKHKEEGQRFIRALKQHGGTLYFSWMHILEAFNQENGPSYQALLKFLNKIGHCWGVLDCDYIKVIEKEKAWAPSKQGPHVDNTMVKEVFLNWYRHRSWLIRKLFRVLLWLKVLRFTPTALFDKMIGYPEDCGKYKEFVESTKNDFKKIFDNARNVVRKNSTAKQNILNQKLQYTKGAPPTDYIRVVLHKAIVIENDNFEHHDGPDLFHAVTATAYSEFVVLDGKWARRLNKVGLPEGVATVYGSDEIDRFLDAFENYS